MPTMDDFSFRPIARPVDPKDAPDPMLSPAFREVAKVAIRHAMFAGFKRRMSCSHVEGRG
jgi:hypothetical protein